MKKKVLFAVDPCHFSKLFDPSDLGRIGRSCEIVPAPARESPDKNFLLRHIGQAHVVITSWGTAALDDQIVAEAGQLELLAHAGGTVKPVVSAALWAKGVRVTSAAAALADGVAEFCLGLILTATKRAFWAGLATRQGAWLDSLNLFHGPQEIYRQNIGVIGAGHVGKRLIRLLRHFDCQVLLYDPYRSTTQAQVLGACKVETLEELFTQCSVVCLNAPSTPETQRMIRGAHFRLLRPGALFINTARGAVVDETEMIEELQTGRFVACIDVTDHWPRRPDL